MFVMSGNYAQECKHYLCLRAGQAVTDGGACSVGSVRKSIRECPIIMLFQKTTRENREQKKRLIWVIERELSPSFLAQDLVLILRKFVALETDGELIETAEKKLMEVEKFQPGVFQEAFFKKLSFDLAGL